MTKKKDVFNKACRIAVVVLLVLSLLHFIFGVKTNNFFSVDDFAVLAYFKDHSVLQMIPDFLLNGDVFGFRKIVGFLLFGIIFKSFSVNPLAFDIVIFLLHSANLVLLYLLVERITGKKIAAFFSAAIFNKYYFYYYSNIHEVLLGFFGILTIYLILHYPKKLYLSLTSFILAMLSKETAVTLPLVLFAMSYAVHIERKKLVYFFILAFIFGLYNLYYFTGEKLNYDNHSYLTSLKPLDIVNGVFFYIDWKIILVLAVWPVLVKKYKYLTLLFAVLFSLLPASILVNRREIYYIYLPFGYLMIYLGLLLPKFRFRTATVYILIFLLFGGRSVLPKIAWQNFPNWQKVSIANVTARIDETLSESPHAGSVNISDINLERDAKLMLESGTTDLFVSPDLAQKYSFHFIPSESKIEIEDR